MLADGEQRGRPLGDVGRDQQAEQENQRDGDEQLRGKACRAVMVYFRAGGAAHRAATFDHRAGALCTYQVLAAHLVPLPVAGPRCTWSDLEP